jgi:hypothetical protein
VRKSREREQLAFGKEMIDLSPAQNDTVKVPRAYLERLTDAVCCAA